MISRLSATWAGLPGTTRGIVMMLLSTLGFSAMHAIIRHVSADLHPIRITIFHFSWWRLRMSPSGQGRTWVGENGIPTGTGILAVSHWSRVTVSNRFIAPDRTQIRRCFHTDSSLR
jgi:hypothetical protein